MKDLLIKFHPFNRIIYDMILKENEQKNKNKVLKNIEAYDISLSIGMIGIQSAGKTSLSKCYQDNKPLEKLEYYVPTISLDFFNRNVNINGKNIKVQIWDTAGQERFNSITQGYLRGLHGCFIIFDVTDRGSYNRLDMWIQFYNDFNQYKERIMIILGNKIDKEDRVVSYKEAKK